MIKRYTTALLGAFTITFFLFLAMNFLITPGDAEKPEVKHHGPIIIGETREVTEPPRKIIKPEKIIEPLVQYDPPEPTENKPTNKSIPTGTYIPPVPNERINPVGFAMPEGDIQPLRKFAPTYPRIMVSRGIEGYVVVKFTVNKMGSVENISILESTNSAFERPSLRAVAKYKYKPRVIDGVAVETRDVMEKISFELEKS